MIEWKTFNKNDPPKLGESYLVWDGYYVDILHLYADEQTGEVKFEKDAVGNEVNVTKYAEINNPDA